MKYAKKMMLVPYTKNLNSQPAETKLLELDNQMSVILKNQALSVDDKVKLYNQALSKFIRIQDLNNAGLAPATVELFKKLTKFLEKPDISSTQNSINSGEFNDDDNLDNYSEDLGDTLFHLFNPNDQNQIANNRNRTNQFKQRALNNQYLDNTQISNQNRRNLSLANTPNISRSSSEHSIALNQNDIDTLTPNLVTHQTTNSKLTPKSVEKPSNNATTSGQSWLAQKLAQTPFYPLKRSSLLTHTPVHKIAEPDINLAGVLPADNTRAKKSKETHPEGLQDKKNLPRTKKNVSEKSRAAKEFGFGKVFFKHKYNWMLMIIILFLCLIDIILKTFFDQSINIHDFFPISFTNFSCNTSSYK